MVGSSIAQRQPRPCPQGCGRDQELRSPQLFPQEKNAFRPPRGSVPAVTQGSRLPDGFLSDCLGPGSCHSEGCFKQRPKVSSIASKGLSPSYWQRPESVGPSQIKASDKGLVHRDFSFPPVKCTIKLRSGLQDPRDPQSSSAQCARTLQGWVPRHGPWQILTVLSIHRASPSDLILGHIFKTKVGKMRLYIRTMSAPCMRCGTCVSHLLTRGRPFHLSEPGSNGRS